MSTRMNCIMAALLALLAGESAARAGVGRAVVVGLEYQDSPNELPGCEGDARSFALTLERQFGFSPSNIKLLLGRRADRADIVAALKQMAREGRLDDISVFYYSGHGSQLEDDNGDEDDGLDETICPWDIVSAPGDPDSEMRDDLIGQLIDQIPGQVVVILDSCHSGTGTRNLTRCGQEKHFSKPGRPRLTSKSPDRREYRELRRKGNEVLIAGCLSTESSRVARVPVESRRFPASALTYFLTEGLRGPADSNGDRRITYSEAISYTRARIDAYYQTRAVDEFIPPVLSLGMSGKDAAQSVQLETNSPDQPVFGMTPQPFYSLISDVAGSRVTLDAGAIHGLQEDMELSVLSRSGQRMGTLRLTSLDAEQSSAEVVSGNAGEFKGLRVWLAGVALPDIVGESVDSAALAASNRRMLTVRMVARSEGATVEVARILAASLGREEFLHVVEDDNVAVDVAIVLAVTRTGAQYSADAAIQRRSGQITDPVSVRGASPQQTADQLARELTGKLSAVYAAGILAEWHNPAPTFGASVAADRGSDRPVYRIGESFSVQVTATADCYVTILDVGTSGLVNVVYPAPSATPIRLAAGKPLRLPENGAFKAQGPAGIDRLKVIATRKPMSLGDMVQTKGGSGSGRSVLASLSRSLRGAAGAKSAGESAVPCSEWAEASLAIQITP